MDYLIYRCTECDHEEVSRNMDGKSCSKCSGPTHPKREADNEEVRRHQDERWKSKNVANRKEQVALDKQQSIKNKLMYIDMLTRLIENEALMAIKGDTANRVQRVCDSIENDLGLKDIPKLASGGIVNGEQG